MSLARDRDHDHDHDRGRGRRMRFAALRTPDGGLDPAVLMVLTVLFVVAAALLGLLAPFAGGGQVTGY